MRILYIDIDSLRPDHLGCYGYHRNTSPTIDRMAEEGVLFERHYASDAPCLPSRSALYSGRFGIQTGVVGHGGTAAQPKIQGPGRGFRDDFDDQGLAHQLQKLGYHTAMISPFGQRHAAWHFYAGFNEIHNTGEGGMESAEIVQPVVDDWLQRKAASDNWFLHINYWDPHTPYRVPAEIENPFADEPLPAWLEKGGVLDEHRKMAGPHTAQDIMMYDGTNPSRYPRQPGSIENKEALRRVIDGYDMGVRYVDDQVAKIVQQLKEAGVYEDTMIIISADHGENLGELGLYAEHATADQMTCRIPLIVKYPGGAQGVRNDCFHYGLDLAPTLMELLGGKACPIWDGESFAAAIRDGSAVGRDEVVISQCAHVCQRSVLWEDYIYIHTIHDGFHLFPEEMLFNLRSDPHEEHNLATEHPEICREGRWRLSNWITDQMKQMTFRGGDAVDPLWTVMREGGPFHARLSDGSLPGNPEGGVRGFLAYLRRLEETGRGEGAVALRGKYAAWIQRHS